VSGQLAGFRRAKNILGAFPALLAISTYFCYLDAGDFFGGE
jgi:hypothetical protein